jgi:hypothetical protein
MVDQYKQQLDGIMQREVSRGEFLKFVGVALLGFVGVVGFFKNLHQIMPPQTTDKNHSISGGYGRSAYGR